MMYLIYYGILIDLIDRDKNSRTMAKNIPTMLNHQGQGQTEASGW